MYTYLVLGTELYHCQQYLSQFVKLIHYSITSSWTAKKERERSERKIRNYQSWKCDFSFGDWKKKRERNVRGTVFICTWMDFETMHFSRMIFVDEKTYWIIRDISAGWISHLSVPELTTFCGRPTSNKSKKKEGMGGLSHYDQINFKKFPSLQLAMLLKFYEARLGSFILAIFSS